MPHNCRGYIALQLLLALLLQQSLLQIVEGRCSRPDDLVNGNTIMRRTMVRFRCDTRYTLIGRPIISCTSDGRLTGEVPFCARSGCVNPPHPENGEIEIQRGLSAVVICKEDFVVAGNALAHCNGINWDRHLGICRHRNHTQSHACDFETEDLCGWTTELGLIQPWRRVATVGDFHLHRTGPRHDHTLQHAYGGHYMLMETNAYAYGARHFVSPIYPRELSLKTACCFRFHYFMYGSGVGSLVVSVKPSQMRLDEMWDYNAKYQKFNVSGNLGNEWREHTIRIDEMTKDFQVVFTVTDAKSRLGDIAIDDVSLITGKECGMGSITTTTEEPVRETDDILVFDFQSCESRCNASHIPDEIRSLYLILGCGCDEQCIDNGNCCPDYFTVCVIPFEETTTTTTTTTTTATPKPTTRPTPTTTTTVKATPKTTPKATPKTTPTTTTKITPKPTPRTTPSTTTPTTTTTRATPVTTKTTTTTSQAKSTKATPTKTTQATKRPHGKYSWPVSSKDLEGDSDRQSSSGYGRFMWYSLLTIVLIIVLASVLYRWRRPNGGTIEKAVSFQKTLATKLKNAALAGGKRLGRSEASTPLCDDEDDDGYDDDVQFEEMGVDIRDVTRL